MIWSLALNSLLRAPRRLFLEAFAVAFPVAVIAATLGFVDATVQRMTQVALEPVQVEMRALGTSTGTSLDRVGYRIAQIQGVSGVQPFASAAVLARRPGGRTVSIRLFAVDSGYIQSHPWLRMVRGRLSSGLLQTDSTSNSLALGHAQTLEILWGNARHAVRLPVDGEVDLRAASTWFQIPAGQVQGDVAVVPRALVVSYPTFKKLLLPHLRLPGGAVANPGLTDLPPLDLELHVAVNHQNYPADPQQAAIFSEHLRRTIEDRGGGAIQVTDDAAEALTLATADATNAKVMFLLLGIPGVLVAAVLGLVASSVLSESYRREQALLRLRGATSRQIARLNAGIGGFSGMVGIAVGLTLEHWALPFVVGARAAARIPSERTAVTMLLAVLAGVLVVVARITTDWRKSRRSEPLAAERLILQSRIRPGWLNARLDVILLPIGIGILLLTGVSGGLNHSIIEDQTQILIQALYVLTAPLLLWLGLSVLAVRLMNNRLTHGSRTAMETPSGWSSAGMRWLGRRPARAMTALLLGVLAVAAGTEIITFVATYRTAVNNEALTSFGADLRLLPRPDHPAAAPPSSSVLAATTPIRYIGARASNGDRKSLLVIDPATYRLSIARPPDVFAGRGPEALTSPREILVSRELAIRFSLKVGDAVTLGLFPDDPQRSRVRTFHVAGVYRLMAPANPYAEAAIGVRAVSAASLPGPDFYLARMAHGMTPESVKRAFPWERFGLSAATILDRTTRDRRSLASLSLDGLSTIEAIAAILAASLGTGVLAAFVVLERGREFAILRAIGVEAGRLVLQPALEMGIVGLGAIALGLPLGVGLAVVSVQIMPLFFILPPPLVTVPFDTILALVTVIVLAGVVLSGTALVAAVRSQPAKLLRG